MTPLQAVRMLSSLCSDLIVFDLHKYNNVGVVLYRPVAPTEYVCLSYASRGIPCSGPSHRSKV